MQFGHIFPAHSLRGPSVSLRTFPDGAGCRPSNRLIRLVLFAIGPAICDFFPVLREGACSRSYVNRLASHRPVPNWLRLTTPWFWSLAAPSTAVPLITPSRIVPSKK